MVPPRCYCYKAISRRGRRLAIPITTPSDDRAVRAQGKTMVPSRCYCYEVISRRGRRLAIPIIAPSDNRAVRAQGKTMVPYGPIPLLLL